jgi:hypothetical protein
MGFFSLVSLPGTLPCFLSKNPGTKYFRPVQDLRAINSATVTLHPVVTNLYTLFGFIPAEAKFFTRLNLKDAFFCICLDPQSQSIFVFQWESSSTGEKRQLTQTRLPQGSKNSLTIFGTALVSDLKAFSANQHDCTLLQYIDDLLLTGPSQEDCVERTCLLLSLSWKAGYKISSKKAQICKIPSNTSGFTCHKDNVEWALRGNRLSAPFQPQDPLTNLRISRCCRFLPDLDPQLLSLGKAPL